MMIAGWSGRRSAHAPGWYGIRSSSVTAPFWRGLPSRPVGADRTPVIAGIGLSDYPEVPELDGVQHHVQAMQRALDDCGVEKSVIDGYATPGGGGMMVDDAVTMAEYLGIDHRWLDGTMTGGSSFEFMAQHAAAAIRDGHAD